MWGSNDAFHSKMGIFDMPRFNQLYAVYIPPFPNSVACSPYVPKPLLGESQGDTRAGGAALYDPGVKCLPRKPFYV